MFLASLSAWIHDNDLNTPAMLTRPAVVFCLSIAAAVRCAATGGVLLAPLAWLAAWILSNIILMLAASVVDYFLIKQRRRLELH